LFRSSCPEAFYSDKRLELQLEGQAARAMEDEALLRRPAAQTTALYGFTHQKTGACVLAGAPAGERIVFSAPNSCPVAAAS